MDISGDLTAGSSNSLLLSAAHQLQIYSHHLVLYFYSHLKNKLYIRFSHLSIIVCINIFSLSLWPVHSWTLLYIEMSVYPIVSS